MLQNQILFPPLRAVLYINEITYAFIAFTIRSFPNWSWSSSTCV